MKAKSVKTGTSDVTLMSVVPVTSVVTVTRAVPVKNAVTVSVVLVTVPSVVSFANTKLQKLRNRASDYSLCLQGD